ncbi:helix-turn-helix protein [Pseudomonas putida]|uniref:Helix-turn-helix protein n=2 Tax=Pseudomonas TaxID=286 RepID=A0A1B2F202_PSEPU|nr:helix-turn-helix protein [Pseudomonas putida]
MVRQRRAHDQIHTIQIYRFVWIIANTAYRSFFGSREMSIPKGFASALRLVRVSRQLNQKDLGGQIASSHISQLEAGKTSPTLKLSVELAGALGVEPVALLAIALAAERGVTPNQLLALATADLEKLQLLDAVPPAEPGAIDAPHPTTARANKANAEVQRLKAQGMSRLEVAQELGLSKTTVQRYWKATAD